MKNVFYKLTVFASFVVLPSLSFAEANCDPLPDCTDIGFVYTASQCGNLKKLKCPFDDEYYFCSKSDCTQVTFNSTTQYCASYCSDTPTMCVAANYKSCDSSGLFATSNGVGKLHTANSTFSAPSSNRMTGNHYFLGDASASNSAYFQSVTFKSARGSYPNNCPSGKLNPKVTVSSYLYMTGYCSFYTDVDFKYLQYSPSNSPSLYFYGNTDLGIMYSNTSSMYSNTVTLVFQAGADGNTTKTNNVCVTIDNSMNDCSNSYGGDNCIGSYRSPFTLTIDNMGTNVKYYVQGGQSSQYVHVNCNNNYYGNGSCTEDWSACENY